MESRRCLNQGVLERISKIIGDTNDGLSGSEIAYFLKQCNIKDVAPNSTVIPSPMMLIIENGEKVYKQL